MADNVIDFTDLLQSGRIQKLQPDLGPSTINLIADFAIASTQYKALFSVVNSQNVFGIPKSVFIDNNDNPSTVQVSVTITGQYFEVPAYSSGMYTLNAQQGSEVSLFCLAGGAADVDTITFYNTLQPPIVWYRFGASPITGFPIYGEDGVTIMSATNPFADDLRKVAGVNTKTGHGTAADTLRVELPTDGTGLVNITGKDGSTKASTANPVAVELGAGAALAYADQQVVTAAAVALTAQALANGLIIRAKSTNAGPVFLGGATVNTTNDGTGNGMALAPGESVSLAISNANGLYIIGTLNDVIYVLGS